VGGQTRRTFLWGTAATGVAAAIGWPLARAATAVEDGGGGVWLPGDLHTHSCYSHDVYCGPTDDNTGPDQAYTAGLPVAGKFAEATERGLRFLAVTDHNDVRSVGDLASAANGLIAIPAYEHSLKGHAQMLGATRQYDPGDQSGAAVAAMADALRGDGGVFQANHPAYRLPADAPFSGCAGGCDDCRSLNWSYGFDVRPDTVEIWNPSVQRGEVSEEYWECWLERGERIGAAGGSDSHWVSLHAVAGPGQPTTWVYAREPTAAGVLEGLRAGRSTISGQPPELGGVPLLLEGPDGAIIGDEVEAGAPLRVHAPGLALPGLVRVRANGETILEQQLDGDGEVTFPAPAHPGWVRAVLLSREALPVSGNTSLGDATPQRDGMPLLGLTSAVYVRPRSAPPTGSPPPVVVPAGETAPPGTTQPEPPSAPAPPPDAPAARSAGDLAVEGATSAAPLVPLSARLAVLRRLRRDELLGPGAPVGVIVNGPAAVRVTLLVRNGRRLVRAGAATVQAPAAGRVELRVRPRRQIRSRLRARRRTLGRVVVDVTASGGQRRTLTRDVEIVP
jgi:hypothetical protein